MARLTNTQIYQDVTDRVLDALKKGVVPWRRPWSSQLPTSLNSKKAYRGVNVLLLTIQAMIEGYSSRWWVTYKQAKKLGGHVKKGEKGTKIVFWNFLEKDKKDKDGAVVKNEDGEAKKTTIPFMKYYTVFNAEQCEDFDIPAEESHNEWDGDLAAIGEAVVENWTNKPAIQTGGDRAYYSPKADQVQLPPLESFNSTEAYYCTVFHELVHSTGHESRLGRHGVTDLVQFGSHNYSKEELIAELGACFVASITGIPIRLDASASYISHWASKIADDPKLVVSAASGAQKAADLILS